VITLIKNCSGIDSNGKVFDSSRALEVLEKYGNQLEYNIRHSLMGTLIEKCSGGKPDGYIREASAKDIKYSLKDLSFNLSTLVYCDDPSLYFDAHDICGAAAEWAQFYTGNFFTPTKAPDGGICYARARYHVSSLLQRRGPAGGGWFDCAGPQNYNPNTSFSVWN
jgi:hypothetical protein